jgi:hypothetical protein
MYILGDHIGRIFDSWAVVYILWTAFLKNEKVVQLLAHFFNGTSCVLFLAKNGFGYVWAIISP